METSLDFTDAFAAVSTLFKADADVVDIPDFVDEITLANRSASEVMIKRCPTTPVTTEGFRLDPQGTGIWYITLKNVYLSKLFLKTTVAAATGEVDASVSFTQK